MTAKTKTSSKGIIYVKPGVASWKVPSVVHRGETRTYEVVGEITPAMTQDKLMSKYGTEIPSTSLIWAILSRAHDLKNENPETAESLRNFIREGLSQFPNTSTRLIYNPRGERDEVIHNYLASKQYSLKGNFVGIDGNVADIPDKKTLDLVLETQDTKKINKVSNWIDNTDFRIWRLNKTPSVRHERVARFVASSGRLGLGCYWVPLGVYPAFRVLRV